MIGSYFWLFLIVGFTLIMFLVVPTHRILELASFGIFFGFFFGIIIMYTGVTLLPLYKLNNELLPIQDWGLSIPLAWIPTTIIFAYFLPKIVDTRLGLYGYILFWAFGTTGIYLLLKTLGYWQDISWNIVYNLLLALSTHIIMATYLYQTKYVAKYRSTHDPK